jgi:hypothetical protein
LYLQILCGASETQTDPGRDGESSVCCTVKNGYLFGGRTFPMYPHADFAPGTERTRASKSAASSEETFLLLLQSAHVATRFAQLLTGPPRDMGTTCSIVTEFLRPDTISMWQPHKQQRQFCAPARRFRRFRRVLLRIFMGTSKAKSDIAPDTAQSGSRICERTTSVQGTFVTSRDSCCVW